MLDLRVMAVRAMDGDPFISGNLLAAFPEESPGQIMACALHTLRQSAISGEISSGIIVSMPSGRDITADLMNGVYGFEEET